MNEQDMLKQIREQEKKLEKIILEQSKDKLTKENKFDIKKIDNLYKKQTHKPEFGLVKYLRNNKHMIFE